MQPVRDNEMRSFVQHPACLVNSTSVDNAKVIILIERAVNKLLLSLW